MLIENVDSAEYIPLIGEKLLAAFKTPIIIERGQLPVSTSIGIAHCPKSALSEQDLIKVADHALYETKIAGRKTWHVISEPEPALRPIPEISSMEFGVRNAVFQEEPVPVPKPKVA